METIVDTVTFADAQKLATLGRTRDISRKLRRNSAMAGTYDESKGRAKEAAGKLTGDKDLEREGKVDRASGKIKQGVDKVKDKLQGKDTDRHQP
jgi:uncharacterized protein YjbJ (UPF0337 family)